LVPQRAGVFLGAGRDVLGFDVASRFVALGSARCLLGYERLEFTCGAHLILYVVLRLGRASAARSGWGNIVFVLARLARVTKVMNNWVPNPLLLATPVYALLSFLSQPPGAPEQDCWPL